MDSNTSTCFTIPFVFVGAAAFWQFSSGLTFMVMFVGVMLLIMLIRTASIHRQHSLDTDQRLCRGCGASHPTYAVFCRRCGRRL